MARLISQLKVAPSLTEAKLHTTSYFTNAGSTQGGFSRMVGDFRNMFTPMNTKSPRLDYFIDDARISLKKYGE